MKEFIANRKLIPLLKCIEKIFEVDTLKYFMHRSGKWQSEIFLTLGETMKDDMLRRARK